MKSFQRALVTGAGAGIGRALTEALIARGCHVTTVDFRPLGWPTAAQAGSVALHIADLSDAAAVDRLLSALGNEPAFDIVIHNAGVSATGRFEDIPAEAHARLLRLNTETPLVLTSAMQRMGLHAPGGNLVFLSSLSHKAGYPGAASYAASKDAVAVYARSIRAPFRKAGISVTAVFPGPVRTDHAARHAPSGAREAARMEPAKLADLILAAASRNAPTLYPGPAAKLTRFAGWLAPALLTRLMRRIIFDKLDGPVW